MYSQLSPHYTLCAFSMLLRPSLRVGALGARSLPRRPVVRSISTTADASSAPPRSSRLGLLALVPVALAGAVLVSPSSDPEPQTNIAALPTSALLRSYFVYTACSWPRLIDAAPGLLHAFTHSPVPGLKAITEAVVRRTFFAQFVAGEDLPECINAMNDLHAQNIGGVLNYSAESEAGDGLAEAHHAAQAHNWAECESAIEALGEFERHLSLTGGFTGTSSFAIKLSGLIDPDILERASTTICRIRPLSKSSEVVIDGLPAPFPGVPQESDGMVIDPAESRLASLPSVGGAFEPLGILAADPGVSDSDLEALHGLWTKMRTLSGRAADLGVKLMIDAELAPTQPALDAFTLLLSMEFNKPVAGKSFNGPVIFGTYQSYLRRAPYLLDAAIRHSEDNGYALGIKLVRGAYFVREREKWRVEGRAGADPIWPDKPATDKAYNDSVQKITSTLARQLDGHHPELALSAVFATHNPESVELVLASMEKDGLTVRGPSSKLRLRDGLNSRVFIAQLYGMRDDITDRVAEAFEPGPPIALKYIAYGKLQEVLPFLARRAIENKSVMAGEGGAAVEKKRVSDELWRRFGWKSAPTQSAPPAQVAAAA